MVDENPEDLKPEEPQGYEHIAVEEEEREVEIPDEEVRGGQSLTDRLAMSPNLSDMQSAMVALFPEGWWSNVVKLYKLMVVGRISPDAFMSLLRILVKEAYRRANPTKPFYVGEVVAAVYAILSKGLDGKGIIDILELAGAARESEELKALSSGGV